MLKKTIAMALVVSAVSGNLLSVSTYAAPMNKNNTEVNNIELSNSPKIMETELKDAYGTVEYRINYDTATEASDKAMKDYMKNIKEVVINGRSIKEGDKEFNDIGTHYYGVSIESKLLTKEENEIIIKSKGYKDVLLKIKKSGELVSEKALETKVEKEKPKEEAPVKPSEKPEVKPSENNNSGENLNKESNLTINDKLENGEYTLGFRAYKENDKTETSMLQGAFDKNIKLTVKDGKYKLSFLNIALSNFLYDFTIGINNKYTKNVMKPYGELDNEGNPTKKLFELEIDNLNPHKAGVLVSAMGGQSTDIGNFDKYTKLDLVFNKEIKKGWEGFDEDRIKIDDEKNFNDALRSLGLDTNYDGIVTNEELSKAKGEIDLSGKKIRDISRLSNLGSEVTELYLNGNKIKEIPKGVFDKLTNLKVLYLDGNRIDILPNGVFKNLKNIEEIGLSSNKLKEIQEDTFSGLDKLNTIGITNNGIKKLPDNIFKNLNSLKGLYLYENNLKELPKSIVDLKELKYLSVQKNELEKLPEGFENLKNIKELDLSGNYIKEIPSKVYDSLKNLESVRLTDNELKEIPSNIIETHPNLRVLEIALNKIDKFPNVPSDWNKTLEKDPQKTISNLEVTAKDNIITWKEDLSMLDLLAWYRGPINEKITNISEYKEFLKGKSVEDFLNGKNYDWTIKTELQKKDKNGNFVTLMTTSVDDKSDENGKYEDKTMKNGDEYRVVKTLYTRSVMDKSIAFRDRSNAIALKKEEPKKDLEKDNNLNVKTNENNKIDSNGNNNKEKNKDQNAKEEKLNNNEVNNKKDLETNKLEAKESNSLIENSNNQLPKTGFEGIGLSLGAGLAAIGGVLLRKKRK